MDMIVDESRHYQLIPVLIDLSVLSDELFHLTVAAYGDDLIPSDGNASTDDFISFSCVYDVTFYDFVRCHSSHLSFCVF